MLVHLGEKYKSVAPSVVSIILGIKGVRGAVWFNFERKSDLKCEIKKHAVRFVSFNF